MKLTIDKTTYTVEEFDDCYRLYNLAGSFEKTILKDDLICFSNEYKENKFVKLNSYILEDNCLQTICVLMYIKNIINKSNDKLQFYKDKIEIALWENFFESGYIIKVHNKNYEQLNIAFFEYRNNDSMRAVSWIQNSIDPLTIDTAHFKDTFDNSFFAEYMNIKEIGYWIIKQLEYHLENC